MYYKNDWAVIIPMANEADDFAPLVESLTKVLDKLESGKVYLVVDNASTDNTRALCDEQASKDNRYITVWSPQNRNVVDAYLAGYRAAFEAGHQLILEMDAGLSHDPRAIPMFLRVLNEGNECAFGSRSINGGSMAESNFYRRMLSGVGTLISNVLLGTTMWDMTSGFQGFHSYVVGEFLKYPLKSKAHFYQTELRYLLRKTRYREVPIHYRAPSASVSKNAIRNSLDCLFYYVGRRIAGQPPHIEVEFKSMG
jgi:dolichol-phosphate mannosyltransferase